MPERQTYGLSDRSGGEGRRPEIAASWEQVVHIAGIVGILCPGRRRAAG